MKPLPVMDVITFPIVQPSTQKTIQTRPYLVKEEKLLLMAQESNNLDEQCEAVAQIIRNCTNGQVEPKTAPFFDIEYFLLQLRARSVGEIATPIFECHTKMPDGSECGHTTPLKINLTEINVTNVERDPKDFVIELSAQYNLHLRYPTVFTASELLLATLNGQAPKTKKTVDALTDLFDTLEDRTANTVISFDDYSVPEKVAFMDNLTTSNYDRLVWFLESMPTLVHETSYTCQKCNTTHTIRMAGLSDFLV